jgi:hypothetical protein
MTTMFCYATPAGNDPRAVKIELSADDAIAFEMLPYPDDAASTDDIAVTVTDQVSGATFAVRRYPCGRGCHCAAQAKRR